MAQIGQPVCLPDRVNGAIRDAGQFLHQITGCAIYRGDIAAHRLAIAAMPLKIEAKGHITRFGQRYLVGLHQLA